MVALIKARSAEAFDEIVKGIEQAGAIYKELSALNLNPTTTMFAVTEPFIEQTHRPLALRTVVLYLALVLILSILIVPIGCLIHHAFRRPASV